MMSLQAGRYRESGNVLVVLFILMLIYGDGCTMRSKCCSPVEKNNVPSVMRPWELPFS
jgi:hypothetical protein